MVRRDRFLDRVAKTIERHAMLRRRDSVLVAVSGGPDSVALLAALSAIGAKRWRIGVAHVNHHLRGRASDQDQRFVERLGADLGVEVFAVDGRIHPGGNLEERARERRYGLLLEIARAKRFRRVATGHNQDDQAETVLFRLLRGAGLAGLAAIAPTRDDGIIRPLLDASREELLGYLKRRRLRFRVDRTNRSRRFARNRIRHAILPLLERELGRGVRATLARTAEVAREDERWLERQARGRLAKLQSPRGIDAAGLARLAPALQRRVLRLWLAGERGGRAGIGLEHVETVRSLVGRWSGRASLPGGTVVTTGGRLRWGQGGRPPRLGKAIDERRWKVTTRKLPAPRAGRPSRWRALFDLALLDGDGFRVRTPQPGDRIRPLGLGGTKKLQDVFVDAKVPREDRSSWPVVEASGTILWVAGLVRSEHATVGPTTRRVLVVEAVTRGPRR